MFYVGVAESDTTERLNGTELSGSDAAYKSLTFGREN